MPRTREQALKNLDVHIRRLRDDPDYRERWKRNVTVANRSPESRARSSARMKEINARRVRCEECGMVSGPASIGRHQAAKGHRGVRRIGVHGPAAREQEREGGRRGGLAPANPEAISASYTPERRADQADRMRVLSKLHWRCTECGKTSNAGGIAKHQKSTGHSGRRRVDHDG